MLEVVVLVFLLFRALADPSGLILGQGPDAATQEKIGREWYFDQPKWKQFVLFLNDISPLAIHTDSEIEKKQLKGIFIGSAGINLAIKAPYLRRSYQTKKNVGEVLMEALPGTLLLAIAAMFIAV